MHAVRMPFFQATMQDRFEVVLRHVDDERIAGLIGKQVGSHRRPRNIGRSFDVADLVDAQGLGQHLVRDAVAAERFQRARQDGAGLGVARQAVVFLEELKRQAVETQAQCRREADRSRAHDQNGLHFHGWCLAITRHLLNRPNRATAGRRSWWRHRTVEKGAARPHPRACRRRSMLASARDRRLHWRRDIAGCQ